MDAIARLPDVRLEDSRMFAVDFDINYQFFSRPRDPR